MGTRKYTLDKQDFGTTLFTTGFETTLPKMESQNQHVKNEYLKLPFGREHGTSQSEIRTQKHIA